MQVQKFDLLLTDLNVGQPGDGFTVVSAMRRTQPDAITLILTGYPAFETALQAIRSQVDEFIMKPVGVDTLVGVIERKLLSEVRKSRTPEKPLSQVLLETLQPIDDRWLREMRTSPEFVHLGLTNHEPCAYLNSQIRSIASKLDGRDMGEDEARLARDHGEQRSRQGSSLGLLVHESHAARKSVLGVIQENLLAVNVSRLIPEITAICDSIDSMEALAMESYTDGWSTLRAS